MQQATHQDHAAQATATATILNFKAPSLPPMRAEDETPGAKTLRTGMRTPNLPRVNGVLLGAILIPAVMAIMEAMRILFAD
ncbi:hypothetical protein WBQ88_17225 [Sphingopyxis sp. CCNWLW253]|uniref:hypothetical protein n=1 Tax=unclassified Sphingopyxis TaxID=2614943 RepID=UPI003012CD54